MPKQEPTPSATNQTVVELSKVKFPSQTDSFRARLAKTDDDVPCSVWVENNNTKLQWSCNVKNTLNHAPTTAKYKLLSKVVIATLQVVSEDEAGDDGFAKLSVEYEFELTPLDVATTDILAAKIRDLQENVKALYVIRLNSPSCARKWMKSAETWVITS
ncbi:hypothetical protein DYB35_003535 [Aphanomyces astaci]|uniref:Uncharacterized protein n=1 Tax=Aphanomyces astaci TaxID=112090 RepID=A0A418DM39_APHAT|nr:hypothetical protein DYB35_003535 [Aphanomyces astaci]